MSFIITAINRNIWHLVCTVVLAVLFLYLVAVFVYSLVPNQYNLGGHFDCQDLLGCFKLHLDYGLFNSPDWIGSLEGECCRGQPYYYDTKNLHDISICFCCNMCLQVKGWWCHKYKSGP